MTDIRPRRSALYLPASNARAIEKARGAPCDVVILDLEDAVAPDMKALAREQALTAVKEGGFGRRELIVRANGLDTPWGAEDLTALAAAGPDAVLVPKISDGAEVRACDAFLKDAPDGMVLWVMIETARAALRLDDIASAARDTRLAGFVMGVNDLAKETGGEQGVLREPFQAILGLSVAAARAYGLAILDGVYNALEDDEGLAQQCAQGRRFGFDGKTLIHPRQIDICNAAFTPGEAEVAWARKIVAAFDEPENASKGAIRVDGKMVERLHLVQAKRAIAIVEAV
ncbi:HpcH/HpaI aldolase/citrate lyase family protein [Flavisphingomonas formosensis]|uniref:HpcH/HpaI aldolase/citrate lyase family protein n=1 Tax=Flavisphingomonas formosensis TaxID=861534 RepID=UPI0012FB74FD|nr:CoA ester lyase [Sphingomonas formosensis]